MRLRGRGVLVGFDGVRGVPDVLGRVIGIAVYSFEKGEQGRVVGVDGGYDGEVVLKFVEVVFGCSDGVVEGVDEGGVVRAEGQFLDVVGKVEACWTWLAFYVLSFEFQGKRTPVVEMFGHFPVSVAPRGDVEVALHFVAVQAAKDAARVALSPQARGLGELFPLLRCTQLVMHIPHVLPPGQTILALPKSMRSLSVLAEICRIFSQQVSR
jgi:hypothetical protein